MARTATYNDQEIQSAAQLVESAKTIQQLREGQSILIPALTGATMDETAKVLGIGRNYVCVLRRQFRAKGGPTFSERDRRGGRRRALMSLEEEQAFLAPWIDQAKSGGVISIPPIQSALESRIGKKVPPSTVYRMLSRHGWRKVTPDTRHPKSNPEVQEDFKKNSRHSSLKS